MTAPSTTRRALGSTALDASISSNSMTALIPLIAALGLAAPAAAAAGDDDASALRREVEALKATVERQSADLAQLRSAIGDEQLTAERMKAIRAVVEDVLADSERRASLDGSGATSGYDKGFFIASPDGNFKLRINGIYRFRYAFSRLSTRSLRQLDPGTYQPPSMGAQSGFPGGSEIKGYQGFVGGGDTFARTARGFEFREAKLDFTGHVVDPSWQYTIRLTGLQAANQTAFSTVNSTSAQAGGVQSTGPTAGSASAGPGAGGGTIGLDDVFVVKQFDSEWSVRIGQFKAPLLREELVADAMQLAAERSLVHQFFSMKYVQGIELQYRNDTIRLLACLNDGGNSSNESATIGNDATLGNFAQYALTARAEWKIAGQWRHFSDFTSYPGDDFAAMIGAAVNWQRGGATTLAAWPNTWSGGGANGGFAGIGPGVAGPAPALQYPNNIPTNANDAVTNLTWTVDTTWDFGGVNFYGAFVGNLAYGIPAGWVANPSGGFTSSAASPPGPANDIPNNLSLVSSGAMLPNGQPGPPTATFVPGYGYGNSPIVSYGVVVQGGWFVVDDIELFARYEWYMTVNNGANAYAGNTPTFWGWLPGGSSPFADNTVNNGTITGLPGPNTGIDSPTDGFIGGGTNPYYAHNLGANPYGAQHNSIITVGANWYPMGASSRAVRVTTDLGYSLGPVLFSNGIYGVPITFTDYRFDGGQGGGGQWVGRFQLQFLF